MSIPSLYRSVPSSVTIGCCVAENDNTGPKNKRELQFVNVQIKKCVAITLRGEKPITDCAEAGLVSCARAGTAGGGKLQYYQRGGMSDRVKKILAHCLATATIAAIGGGGAYAGWMALSWLLTYFFPLCGSGILDQLGAVVIPLLGTSLGLTLPGDGRCVWNQKVWTAVIAGVVALFSGWVMKEKTWGGAGPVSKTKALYNAIFEWWLGCLGTTAAGGAAAPPPPLAQVVQQPGEAAVQAAQHIPPPVSAAEAAQLLLGMQQPRVDSTLGAPTSADCGGACARASGGADGSKKKKTEGGRRRRRRRSRRHRRRKRRHTRKKRRHTRRKHRRRRRKRTKRRRKRC